jgi:hypothetical protein
MDDGRRNRSAELVMIQSHFGNSREMIKGIRFDGAGKSIVVQIQYFQILECMKARSEASRKFIVVHAQHHCSHLKYNTKRKKEGKIVWTE